MEDNLDNDTNVLHTETGDNILEKSKASDHHSYKQNTTYRHDSIFTTNNEQMESFNVTNLEIDFSLKNNANKDG